MFRYIVVPESEVEPSLVTMVREVVRRALPELGLGASPEIRWFADARELAAEQVAAARDVFIPADGIPKAGNVPPFVSYSDEKGWDPPAPLIMLNRTQCLPDTALHELRHLWQIKAGVYRADEDSSRQLEDDADNWAASAMIRLGIRYQTERGTWRGASGSP